MYKKDLQQFDVIRLSSLSDLGGVTSNPLIKEAYNKLENYKHTYEIGGII